MALLSKIIKLSNSNYETLKSSGSLTVGSTVYSYDSTGTVYLVPKELAPNPNFLINPDFSINQRGKTSYTSTGSRLYTVDRWCIVYGTATPLSSGIKLSNPNGSSASKHLNFRQYFENPTYFQGKTMTLSFVASYQSHNTSYTAPSIRIVYKYNNGSDQFAVLGDREIRQTGGFHTSTFTFPSDKEILDVYVEIRAHMSDSNIEVTVNWIKLEFGPDVTAYTPPTPLEWFKCQRYYQYFDNFSTHGFLTNSGKNYYISVPLTTKMRTRPSLDVVNFNPYWTGYNRGGNSNTKVSKAGSIVYFISASSYSIRSYGDIIVLMHSLSASAGDTNNAAMSYYIAKVGLDAEMY